MEKFPERKKIIIILVLSLLIRITFILTLKNHFYFDDEQEYFNMVKNILSGKGVIVSEQWKAYRPPLYPLFLSFFYFLKFNLFGIRFLQSIISSFTSVYIYLLGKKVFSERVGWISGLIACVYPFFIFYTGFLLTETLFIFLVVLTIYTFIELVEKQNLCMSIKAGLFLGITGLCRPTIQLFFPVSIFLILFFKDEMKIKFKKILFGSLSFFITLSPWVIRNYSIFHKIIPGTTMGGRVFWEGNNPYSEGGPCRYFPEEIEKLPEVERDIVYYKKTVEIIRKNPYNFLWLLQNKFKRFWNVVPNASGFTKPLYQVISVMSFGIILPFFVLGFILTLQFKQALYIHSLIILFTIFHMLFLASIRYRVPIEPFYIIFAVYGFFWLYERILCIIKNYETIRNNSCI